MIQIKKQITLITISVLFLIGFFYSDVSGRGFVRPQQPDASFLHSSGWPQCFQDYLRRELIYGDHKIDELEVKYLLNAAFKSQSTSLTNIIKPTAAIMTILPTEANAIDVCITQVSSHTNDSNEKIKGLLDSELEKNRSEINSVKSFCREVITKSVKLALEDNNISDWLFYQLLKTDGITPDIYVNLIKSGKFEIDYAIEPLKFLDEPNDYVFSMAKVILSDSGLTWKRLKLAELCEYMNASGGRKLIDMLQDSIPHFTDAAGTVQYRYANFGPDIELEPIFGDAIRHFMVFDDYSKADTDKKLLDFFSAATLPGKHKEDKNWLLYRYHPELMLLLTSGREWQK